MVSHSSRLDQYYARPPPLPFLFTPFLLEAPAPVEVIERPPKGPAFSAPFLRHHSPVSQVDSWTCAVGPQKKRRPPLIPGPRKAENSSHVRRDLSVVQSLGFGGAVARRTFPHPDPMSCLSIWFSNCCQHPGLLPQTKLSGGTDSCEVGTHWLAL